MGGETFVIAGIFPLFWQIEHRILFRGIGVAINTKEKRKIIFNNEVYYWFVKIENDGSHRIYILTEDKKINRVYPMVDTEVSVTPSYICKLLDNENAL